MHNNCEALYSLLIFKHCIISYLLNVSVVRVAIGAGGGRLGGSPQYADFGTQWNLMRYNWKFLKFQEKIGTKRKLEPRKIGTKRKFMNFGDSFKKNKIFFLP